MAPMRQIGSNIPHPTYAPCSHKETSGILEVCKQKSRHPGAIVAKVASEAK